MIEKSQTQAEQEEDEQLIREILKNHEDEHLPVYDEAKLAIVIPVYRELSNGNVANILETTSITDVPKNEFATIFVVNNPLPELYLAQLKQLHPNKYYTELMRNLRAKIDESTLSERAVSDIRNMMVDSTVDTQVLDRMVQTVNENQTLYRILKLIETSHNKSNEEKSATVSEIEKIWHAFSDRPLPLGFEIAVRRNSQIAVVDNFSAGKCADWRDIGKQRREGVTLAFEHIAPNAKFTHFSDADTSFTGREINYLLDKSDENYDAIILQQYAVVQTHPEQLKETDKLLLELMSVYFSVLVGSVENYSRLETSRLGGSQLAISRDTYHKFPYPSGINEDFNFSRQILSDESVKVLRSNQAANIIILNTRSRQESYDGGHFYSRSEQPLQEVLDYQDRARYENIIIAIKDDARVRERISRINDAQEQKRVQDLYEKNLEEFKKLIYQDRKVFQRRAKMLINLLTEYLLEQKNNQQPGILEINAGRRLTEFLHRNPLLFRKACDLISGYINENPQASRDQIVKLLYTDVLEKYFSEYFTGPNIMPEQNSEEFINNLRGDFENTLITDVLHVTLATNAINPVLTEIRKREPFQK